MKKKNETGTIYQLYFICSNGVKYLVHEDTDVARFWKKEREAYNHNLTGVRDMYQVRRIERMQLKEGLI